MRKGIYGSSAVTVLIVAMTMVATTFASTIVYFETSTARVQLETDGMLSNGVPRIDRLTDARTTLRKLDGAMDRALLDLIEKQPAAFDPIRAARRNLADDIAAYRLLPAYELESDINRDFDIELGRLDEVRQRFEEQLARANLQAAHEMDNGEWRQSSDRVDDQLRTLISLNLRHVTWHARRIDDIRRRASLVGLGVGCGALLLACAATLIAARAVRRQTLLQEERARELEMFSARVAHDLMSPMTAVSIVLGLVKDQTGDAAVAHMVGRAVGSLRRVHLVVDGLLEFARSGGRPALDERAPVPKILADIVDELRPYADQSGVTLALDGAPSVEVVCAPGILCVLVTNLVNNAIKYMADSATRRVTVRAAKCKSGVCFEVEDTGPGLSPGFESLAFEPYMRGATDTVGLGLGLATVKRLVTAHGGRVGVRPREGSGAIFWFELPQAVYSTEKTS
jgi:signal transduction histidine kinase